MKKNAMSIDDVPLNGFHRLLTARSGGGWIMDGYVVSILGVALVPMSRSLSLDDFWQGMIAASALIGIFLGGLLGGAVTDYVGRQKMYFVAPVLFVLCSVLQFWVTSASSLFLLRMFIGLGIGVEYPVAGSLLVEFIPSTYRGPLLASLTTLWFGGAAMAYMVGTLLLNVPMVEAWRLVLASPAAIGVMLIILRIGTPESPRWLVSKGRHHEAERIIKKVYGNSFSLANLPQEKRREKKRLKDILHGIYGQRLFFVVIFWTCAIIPVFALYAFVPKVLLALNLKGTWATFASPLITMMFVVGCLLASRIVNVIGRRKLIIHSFLWSGLALMGLGIFPDAGGMAIVFLFCFYAVAIGGAQVLELVYPNELFPTEIRALAVGIGTSLSRIGAAAGTWLVPLSLEKLGTGNTMLAAAAVTFAGLACSVLFAPETSSLSLEEASASQ